MDRSDLMDKLEEIQNKNYSFFKGVNEADLATREDIADLFEQLLNKAREGKTIHDAPAGGLGKHDVIKSVCAKCKAENIPLINGCCYGCICLQG